MTFKCYRYIFERLSADSWSANDNLFAKEEELEQVELKFRLWNAATIEGLLFQFKAWKELQLNFALQPSLEGILHCKKHEELVDMREATNITPEKE